MSAIELASGYGAYDPRIDLVIQYSLSVNVQARFVLYDRAVDGRNIHQEIVQGLDLTGDETIVDFGCADGMNILRPLRTMRGHRGPLIGIDLNTSPDLNRRVANWGGIIPIDFIQASVTETGLPDNSVDVVVAAFVLYHVNPPEAALQEALRILKPGGQIVGASSDASRNKMQHRWFERMGADIIGIEHPPIFAATCDLTRMTELMQEFFVDVQPQPRQQTRMRITPESLEDYLYSLMIVSHTIDEIPESVWRQYVKNIVKPVIEAEISEQGYFEDIIDRGVVTAIKAP